MQVSDMPLATRMIGSGLLCAALKDPDRQAPFGAVCQRVETSAARSSAPW
ncbi:MAG: hypothetical protein AAFP17_13130 [Pseudomonadota bacterium]